MKRLNSQRIASIGILSALSVIIAFGRFPILPMVPFLELDFADVPIFIATFMYGPLTGLAITTVVCLVQGITVSLASGGFMGIVMHLFATGSFVLVSGAIYKKFHTIKGAIIALIFGILTWNIVMVPFNLLITPLFLGGYEASFNEVVKLLPFIVAFNVIKSVVNSVLTLIVYKYTHKIINKMLPENGNRLKNNNVTDDNITSTKQKTSEEDNVSPDSVDETNKSTSDYNNI